MTTLIDLIADGLKLSLILAVIATGLAFIFNPAWGRALLKRVVWAAIAVGIGLGALNCLAGSLSGSGTSFLLPLLPLLLVACLVAYGILMVRRRRAHTQQELRGAERTPFVPQHLDGEGPQ